MERVPGKLMFIYYGNVATGCIRHILKTSIKNICQQMIMNISRGITRVVAPLVVS
jgi:hypothetical protein